MQLLSLSTLLAGVLVMISTQVVESLPIIKRNSRFVTMPLKRVEQARDLHPQIVGHQVSLIRLTRGANYFSYSSIYNKTSIAESDVWLV
jgi:hypothetical protein